MSSVSRWPVGLNLREREREREREKDSVACQREREKRDRSKTNRDDLKLHETKKLVGGDEPENVN